MPTAEHRAARLDAVMHVLYLLFSEGYATSAGPELQRADLAVEAIRLTRMLRRLLPESGEVAGLLALMLLTDARRAARTGPTGELIALDEQDRSVWDKNAIAEGVALLSETLPRGEVGLYQLQAAVAAVHDEAERAEDTDWAQILALYELMLGMSENPVIALSHAVALAMVQGPEAGLSRLEQIAGDPRLAATHRLDAVRGHLLERAGRREAAIECYVRAEGRTASVAERNYLLARIARLRGV